MRKPLLLDLFCGAGGCAKGYHDAGFEVVGVDIKPQPHYPYEFHQADALTYPLNGFDVIHASPPCQAYSASTFEHRKKGNVYPDLLNIVRKRLLVNGKPWIIENVIGAPVQHGMILCGSQFGLKVRRHRYFETSLFLFAPGPCRHIDDAISIFGHCRESRIQGYRINHTLKEAQDAMGIDWMNQRELTQAIPPAYTRWIGLQFMDLLRMEVSA
jgi:DNA (cytosine-5)-methyltransferase 1